MNAFGATVRSAPLGRVRGFFSSPRQVRKRMQGNHTTPQMHCRCMFPCSTHRSLEQVISLPALPASSFQSQGLRRGL